MSVKRNEIYHTVFCRCNSCLKPRFGRRKTIKSVRCKNCKKIFEYTGKIRKFCSRECYHQSPSSRRGFIKMAYREQYLDSHPESK